MLNFKDLSEISLLILSSLYTLSTGFLLFVISKHSVNVLLVLSFFLYKSILNHDSNVGL
jgi:hypothetical protein